jgi:hypothetical protein
MPQRLLAPRNMQELWQVRLLLKTRFGRESADERWLLREDLPEWEILGCVRHRGLNRTQEVRVFSNRHVRQIDGTAQVLTWFHWFCLW